MNNILADIRQYHEQRKEDEEEREMLAKEEEKYRYIRSLTDEQKEQLLGFIPTLKDEAIDKKTGQSGLTIPQILAELR